MDYSSELYDLICYSELVEDSYIDMGGYGEANEMILKTVKDKKNILYDFMIYLCEKEDK